MKAVDLLNRARSASGKKIKYKLGSGGLHPSQPLPANLNHECDCSGYVCWALQISRKTEHPLYVNFNGGWINTDAMVHDGNKSSGYFEPLAKPKIGALIVYGRTPQGTVGHVGIVTALDANGAVSKVIHCSNGNYKNLGDAIQETAPTVFQKQAGTVYVWYAGLT